MAIQGQADSCGFVPKKEEEDDVGRSEAGRIMRLQQLNKASSPPNSRSCTAQQALTAVI